MTNIANLLKMIKKKSIIIKNNNNLIVIMTVLFYLCKIQSLHKLQVRRRGLTCFVVRGESPGCRLFSTASMWERLRDPLPHLSQGNRTERWSRNTLRVVTARVFLRPQGVFNVPFILTNSMETAVPFNVVSHPRYSEPRN